MATVPVTTAPLTAPGGVLEGLGSNEPKQMGRASHTRCGASPAPNGVPTPFPLTQSPHQKNRQGQLANTKHNLVYNILAVLVPPLAVGLKTGDGCEAISASPLQPPSLPHCQTL